VYVSSFICSLVPSFVVLLCIVVLPFFLLLQKEEHHNDDDDHMIPGTQQVIKLHPIVRPRMHLIIFFLSESGTQNCLCATTTANAGVREEEKDNTWVKQGDDAVLPIMHQ
jgi:hypothetical protein